ncbi:MAG: hypothetical protein ABIM98_08055 [candidate division WOR-3 bacterium]
MKELIEKMKKEINNLIGIVICDLNKEEIIEREGKTELFEEGILLIGSTAKLALEKNIGMNKFDIIEIELKTGEKINLFMKENLLTGVIGEELDLNKIKEVITKFETLKEIKEEKKPEEEIREEKPEEKVPETEIKEEIKEYIPTPEEKIALNKVEQINELIKEFAPGDEIRWAKVAIAKIKDTSPELAQVISQEEKEIKINLPFKEKINEEEINKAFRAVIDIIWKMAVSKYGVEEARKKVKKVAEKLKLI